MSFVHYIVVAIIPVAFVQAVSAAGSRDFEKVQTQVDYLTAAARKCETANELVDAEQLLKQALALLEPFADRRMTVFGARYSILTSLISVYERESRWEDIENLYENNENIAFGPSEVDKRVAKLLIKQGRYKDARAILRSFVPQMKPPFGPRCGAVDASYYEWQELLQTCADKTPDATDAELDELWRQRQKNRHGSSPPNLTREKDPGRF